MSCHIQVPAALSSEKGALDIHWLGLIRRFSAFDNNSILFVTVLELGGRIILKWIL
jgi:hypothetical protein